MKMNKSNISQARTAYGMIAPAMLIIMGLGLFPALFTLWFSLNDVNPGSLAMKFVGLKNYTEVMSTSAFWNSLKITLYFSLVSVVVQIIMGTLVSLLLNQNFKGRGFVRGIILIPWAVPTIVNANLWKWIFNANAGVLNKVLLKLHLIDDSIVWLGSGKLAINMIILSDTWKMLPLVIIMLLAGLQTVSNDAKEAAIMDGANAWQRFKAVYFQALKPMYIVVLVLRTIQTIRVFDIVYSLTSGGPNDSTQVISFYAYHEIFDYLHYGKGSAICVIIAVIILLLSILYLKAGKTEDYDMNRMIKRRIGRILLYLAVTLLLLWTLLPIIWMFISSIISENELLSSDKILPTLITWERYKTLLWDQNPTKQVEVFRMAIKNSCIVAGVTTIISLVFGAVASYAFARLHFRMKRPMLFGVMFFQLLPPIALVIPYYIMISRMGLLDHLGTLILINTNAVLAYVIWVLNGYFKSVPFELEEAGRVDGCSWNQVFWKIIMPTALPGYVAVGVLAFLMAWDEFLYALIFTTSKTSKTLTVAVSEFGTKYGIDYGMMMTAGLLATVIPMVLALIFQRYIVGGLTAGAVKG